jgi:hypothetical protein
MTAGHACCHVKNARSVADSPSFALSTPEGAVSCPYQKPTADAAKKFRTPMAAASVAQTIFAPALQIAFPRPEMASSRLPDRGGTHLRFCVFLI